MARRMTSKQAYARYEMFMEAAEHLNLSVTDDKTEQAQVAYVRSVIHTHADRWFSAAHKLEKLERQDLSKRLTNK